MRMCDRSVPSASLMATRNCMRATVHGNRTYRATVQERALSAGVAFVRWRKPSASLKQHTERDQHESYTTTAAAAASLRHTERRRRATTSPSGTCTHPQHGRTYGDLPGACAPGRLRWRGCLAAAPHSPAQRRTAAPASAHACVPLSCSPASASQAAT
jgi:hypothetical protein